MLKILSCCFLIVASYNAAFSQDQSLNGKWFLEEISLQDSTIIPAKGRFFVFFDGKDILFNMEKNSCGMTAKIENNTISDCRGACTKVCCDDWYGTTSKYFNLNGRYKLDGDLFILNNEHGKLTYRKSTNND